MRQGVAVWNQWREENPDVVPDLSGSDLRYLQVIGGNYPYTELPRINLSKANLRDIDIGGADFSGANFSSADLRGASLVEVNLPGSNFTRADLIEVDLSLSILIGATLEAAQLMDATLKETVLDHANLRDAVLDAVDWINSSVDGTDVTHAYMIENRFSNMDLRGLRGLETVEYDGPSTIGIDTLYRSRGDIPDIFLRGCGVPDSMIAYARSLVAAQRPIDYYSCFISYSSDDEAVAQRLHADLQAAGVRCWFAPHDLEIGEVIVRGIDEAIRFYDKLLIILSAASVKSHWVEFEVSTALHREIEQGRTMLFPIRLDDAVLYMPKGWAAQLRSRHIGDFRDWKDHDHYQGAFNRLLRDLKAKAEV